MTALPLISTEALRTAEKLALWRNYWSPGGLELTHSVALAMNLPTGSHVLDAGCGSGESSYYLQDTLGWNVLAADQGSFGLKLAEDKFKHVGLTLRTINTNLLKFPSPESLYDGIFSQGTFFMFGTARKPLLREWHRILKAGGVIGIGDPMLTRAGKSRHSTEMITLAETVRLIQNAGFTIELAELHPDGARMWEEFHAPHFTPTGEIRRIDMADAIRAWRDDERDLLGIGVVIARKL